MLVHPLVTTTSKSSSAARARVLSSFRDWIRAAPKIVHLYNLEIPVTVVRKRIRQEYEKNRYVEELPIVDLLLFKGRTELEETMNLWKQDTHVMRYFSQNPYAEPPPTTFLGKFLEHGAGGAAGDDLFQEDEEDFDELAEAGIGRLADLESDPEGEDLFGEDMDRDYRENAKLDRYDVDQEVDEEEVEAMDMTTRQLVEAKLRRRDREKARNAGLAGAFLDDGDEFDMPLRVRRRRRNEFDPELEMEEDQAVALDLEALVDIKGAIADYVTMEGPQKAIKREFQRFLTCHVNEAGESVYGGRIKALCEANGESLEVSYEHIHQTSATLAYLLSNSPAEILKIFDVVALEVVLSGYEEYDTIKSEIHVRITDLPAKDSLRDLRQSNLNTLIRVAGVVTRRTGVFPQLKYVKYDCVNCGAVIGPFYQDATREIKLNVCPNCSTRGPFNINSEQTIYQNYQRLTLQESPGTVPAGRLPRHKDVIVLWDLVDAARPGDEIEVTGIYRNTLDISLNARQGFPVFSTVIEANHILKKTDQFASFRLTEEDTKAIRELAKDERIRTRIIKSIAPSIYGHEDIKTAVALAMFGGVFKNPQGKHRLRGDINVLILGDPGTAKSQFLKYVEKTAHRAVYTTGQGASAVGLTASVRKDPITREWTLEGGALVMADKGVCLIDEFDKMNDQDRTSIHEAMEQQSISISKAGIVTTLQARCSVIAAANPLYGKYNASVPFSQNVELTEPILSRFDVLCVVRDLADPVRDEMLSRFVIGSHMRCHPDAKVEDQARELEAIDPDIIPQDLLCKYIMYAKDRVTPTITNIDSEKLERLYAELRRESMIGTGSIPITVRYLESIVRMSEAFARMHLRDHVRQDDIDQAIAVTIRSFIEAQKQSVKKVLSKVFDKYLVASRDNEQLLVHLLSEMERDIISSQYYKTDAMPVNVSLDVQDLELRARNLGIHSIDASFYQSPAFATNFTLVGKRIVSK